MMNLQSLLFFLTLKVILAAPIVVTRVETADAVTVTDTYTTVTNTHTAATVEYFISDGVTYTYTLSGPDATTLVLNSDTTGATDATEATEATEATTDAAVTTADENTDTTTTLAPTDAATTDAVTTSTTDAVAITTTADATEATTSSETTEVEATTEATTEAAISTPTSTSISTISTVNKAASAQTSNTATTTVSTTHQAPTAFATSVATTSGTITLSSTSTSTTSTSTTSTETTADFSTESSSSSVGKLTSKPTALVYSPYNDDNSCKDYAAVSEDLAYIQGTLGVNKIRVYGTDCNSVQNVETVALALGITINQGFWISSEGADSIDDGVDDVISWASTNGWSVFDFITIGNEAIQAGYVTVDELLAKIASVTAKLQAAGYTGKITTSEPPYIFVNNPSLCTSGAIDFAGVNPHSYFDTYSSAATSGTFVKGQVALVQEACGDIDVVVTETGYPSAGIQNGGNIPSKANQLIAVQAILDEMDCDVTILSTYNDYWKAPGDYGIEQSFGIWDLLD